MNKILANCISLGIGLGAIGVAFPAQAASFQGLGDLPGGIFHSLADGVSANGSVVVGRGNSANGFEASRWTQATGMVGVGNSPIMHYAWGVSADGSVVVGQGYNFIANGPEALRWTQQTGIIRLGDLPGGVSVAKLMEHRQMGLLLLVLAIVLMVSTRHSVGHKQRGWLD
jgi:hypothetical protein